MFRRRSGGADGPGMRPTCRGSDFLIAGSVAACGAVGSTMRERLKQVSGHGSAQRIFRRGLCSMKGQVLVYQGYGLADRKTKRVMSRDEVIDSGSLSKQVTAAAAMKLVSLGKLSLDDPLSKFSTLFRPTRPGSPSGNCCPIRPAWNLGLSGRFRRSRARPGWKRCSPRSSSIRRAKPIIIPMTASLWWRWQWRR